MTSPLQLVGFGVLSAWNGDLASSTAITADQAIAAAGANSIEITPRLWTATQSSTAVLADPAKTDSDASLEAGLAAAKAAGLAVVLKPNLASLDGKESFQLTPSDPAAFFASYKAEIVHLATIAQQSGVDTFCIGSELGTLTGPAYLSQWTDIIAAVRQVYRGTVSYAAAIDEAASVSFWSQLDTIGVNAYPPLSDATTPTVAALEAAWQSVPSSAYYAAAMGNKSPVDFLKSLATTYGKQVLLTEVGYRSIDATAADPGDWSSSGAENDAAQANAYEAFARVFSAQGGNWLKGAEFWDWNINNDAPATGYEVAGKPALAVAENFFAGAYGPAATVATVAAPSVAGEIYELYDGLLGRLPDPTGLADDMAKIQGGTALTTIAQSILNSAEFTARFGDPAQMSNQAMVTQLYAKALHRAPDAAGLQDWTGLLDAGTARATVAVGIAVSPEHQALMQSELGAGTLPLDSTTAAVARLYYAILDRAPDLAGLENGTASVDQGTSLQTVASNFFGSAEYRAQHASPSPTEVVAALYQGALGRTPDAGGLTTYLAAIGQGTSYGAVAVSIAESPEAQAHLLGRIALA